MFKVYKSTEVKVGEKKAIQYNAYAIKNVVNLGHEVNAERDIAFELQTIEEQKNKILFEASRQSNEIVQKARDEAEAIIAEAYNDSKSIFEAAKRKGFEEGFQQGKTKGYDEVEALILEAKNIKQTAQAEKKQMAKSLEKEIITLVVESIKAVINYELQVNHELLLNLIQKGLEKSTFTESLIIRVAEDDFELVNNSKNKIFMMAEGIDEIEVKKDGSLEKGSIIIETQSGTIDSSIHTQLSQIQRLFEDLLKRE